MLNFDVLSFVFLQLFAQAKGIFLYIAMTMHAHFSVEGKMADKKAESILIFFLSQKHAVLSSLPRIFPGCMFSGFFKFWS
jgi:hypothetical protein